MCSKKCADTNFNKKRLGTDNWPMADRNNCIFYNILKKIIMTHEDTTSEEPIDENKTFKETQKYSSNFEDQNDQNRHSSSPVLQNEDGDFDRMNCSPKQYYTSEDLLRAVEEGHAENVKDILDSGVDTDVTNTERSPLLHIAALKGYEEVVKLLLDNGYDYNTVDPGRRTALHMAIKGRHSNVVFLLTKSGLVPETRDREFGNTPLHMATLHNSINAMKIMLEPLIEDPWGARHVLGISNKEGKTALHIAAAQGLTAITENLLAAGADVNKTDNDGNTPMHATLTNHRAKRRCNEVLSLLLDSGGYILAADQTQEEDEKPVPEDGNPPKRKQSVVQNPGDSLIHVAAEVGCSHCMDLIISKGVPVDIRDEKGRTPLHITVSNQHKSGAEYLIQHGAEIEAEDAQGRRPLHCAIEADSDELTEFLVKSNADYLALDSEGRIFSQIAVARQRWRAFESLIKNNAAVMPGGKEEIMHFCAIAGSIIGTKILLKNQYDPNKADSLGRSPILHALNFGHEELVNFLIENGASLKIADSNGATPLHYAVRWGGSDAILRLMVKRKVNVKATDRLGRTPLHYAACKSNVMSDMYILVGNGAELNAKDQMGLTPLHLAARIGNESLVRILLDSGASHDIPDVYNFLPIDHAKENKHCSITQRLQDYGSKFTRSNSVVTPPSQPLESTKKSHRLSIAW